MMSALLGWTLTTAQLLLLAAMAMAIVRMLRGPRAQDRVAALDALYINTLLLMLATAIDTASSGYVTAALVIAIIGFASSSALARFLLRGEVIE